MGPPCDGTLSRPGFRGGGWGWSKFWLSGFWGLAAVAGTVLEWRHGFGLSDLRHCAAILEGSEGCWARQQERQGTEVTATSQRLAGDHTHRGSS